MKVLCIGSTSYDITCETDGFPVENSKNRYENPVRCGGGTASNTAYLLGKWGVETTIATVLGSDDYAELIKKEFASVNVDTGYIETDFENGTPLSFILVNKQNGKRTIFNVASERKPLKRSTFEFTPDVIYTDGKDYGASQSALVKYPGSISVIDAEKATKDILELCKYIKYIVCSKVFAETLSGMTFDFNNPQSLVEIFSKLQAKYPKSEIIITLEDRGAMYKENNQIKIMPGLKVDVVDSTGAGDIFHGAFTYGLINGFSIEKCVAFANIAGGLSCTKMGGRFSVPSLSEVTDEYNKKGQVVENSTKQPVNPQPNVVQEPVSQANENNATPAENQIPVQNNNEFNNVNMVNQPQMAVNTASTEGAVAQAIPVDNNNTIPESNIQ